MDIAVPITTDVMYCSTFHIFYAIHTSGLLVYLLSIFFKSDREMNDLKSNFNVQYFHTDI